MADPRPPSDPADEPPGADEPDVEILIGGHDPVPLDPAAAYEQMAATLTPTNGDRTIDSAVDAPPARPAAAPGPAAPASPPVERNDWASAPSTWPRFDPPPVPVDASTVSTRSAAVGAIVGGAVAVVLFALGSWLFGDGGGGDEDASDPTTTTVAPAVPPGLIDIDAVLEKVQPSVVTLEGTGGSAEVFGSAGTGIVLTADGLVLTNAHVITGLEEITVTTFDGSTYAASPVGSLPDEDIALIQLRGVSGLVPAELGSSDDVEVGDDVVAIGNAFNLGGSPSVTKGIVSATNRTISGPGYALTGLIQTDAAINPGNSGGPLVDAAGQVVGVNTAIIEASQNVGFSIGIDVVKPLIEDIQAGGADIAPDDAFLGASGTDVEDMSDEARQNFGISAAAGAFVDLIEPESPAEKSALQLADVVLAVDGTGVDSWAQLDAQVRAREPGNVVELEIQRFGDTQTITVTLGRRGG